MPGKLKYQILTTVKRTLGALLLGAICVGIGPADAVAEVQTSFLYRLSNFSGPIPFNWANIHFDEDRSEIYVTDSRIGQIRIFNAQGMEIYRFGDDWNLGTVLAAAVKRDGNILVLNRQVSKTSIYLCNFRGEPISELALKNLPTDFEGFSPTGMVYRHGRLYLLDNHAMRIAVMDSNGVYQAGYDIASLIKVAEKKRGQTEIGGFSVDREGNILFTVPVLFLAFKLSPDGHLSGFGQPGSAPGRFNNVGGIVADDRGYYYVADRLKSVVLIFDKDFNFVKEFGYRGRKPANLISPRDLSLDAQGRLYVSQLSSRGVSVFKITYK